MEFSHLTDAGVVPGLIRENPLLFLHIPKTGGTSITDAVAQLYGARRVFGQSGYLSVEYLSELGSRLKGSVFIAGHVGPGVLTSLAGKADIFTVLRNPCDHAVSNYLHIAASPESPLYDEANQLDFASFLRRNPEQAHLQAVALAAALSQDGQSVEPREREGLRTIQQFLCSLSLVGVIERADAVARVLAALLGLNRPLELARLNSAACRGVGRERLAGLKSTYAELRFDPQLAPLFAAEEALYDTAAQALVRAERNARLYAASLNESRSVSEPLSIEARSFFSNSGVMRRDEIECRADLQPSTLIHGPYRQFPQGWHRVEYLLCCARDDQPAGLKVKIQVFANGHRTLSAKRIYISKSNSYGSMYIYFYNRDPSAILEFRVRSQRGSKVEFLFQGVRIFYLRPNLFQKLRLRCISFITGLATFILSQRSTDAIRARFCGTWVSVFWR